MVHESALLQVGPKPYVALSAFSPSFKIIAVACFAVCTSLLSRHSTAFAACCIPFLLAIAGKVAFKAFACRLLPVNFFFIFLWIFLPINITSGAFLFSWQGVELAALITLKGNAIASLLLLFLGTSTVSASCRGLLKLHVPDKFVTLLLLTYSNLAYMTEEYAKMSAAAKLRGFAPGKTFAGYQAIASLAAMLLVRSWQRSQRVGKAMQLRGFSGKYPLLELPPAVPYSRLGPLFCLCLCFISIVLLCADFFLPYLLV